MRPFILLAPLVFLGCVETSPPGPGPEPGPVTDSCGAASLQYLVGQPARVLSALTFSAPTRVIEPGMAVTMDYLPNRLNIWLAPGRVQAEGNVINRVTCG